MSVLVNLQNETDACSAETKSSGAWHSAWPSPLGGPFHGIVREWTAFDHKGGKVFKITDGDGDELVLAASLKDCETWARQRRARRLVRARDIAAAPVKQG